MTDLRVVSINGERTIPVGPLNDVVSAARGFADKIEAGEISPTVAILITVEDGKLEFACLGPSPSIAEGLGLLDLAKARIVEGAWRPEAA